MPGTKPVDFPEWRPSDNYESVKQTPLVPLLERIASALEEANRLNAPAAEINAFNLKQLKAATEGGILSAPGQILRK